MIHGLGAGKLREVRMIRKLVKEVKMERKLKEVIRNIKRGKS